MKYISSFDLTRKISIRKIVTIALAALLGVLTTILAVKAINDHAIAATPTGSTVDVSYSSDWVHYGEWETPIFNINTGSGNFVGACVDPGKNPSSGQLRAERSSESSEAAKQIKLAIVIYSTNSSYAVAAQNDVFGAPTAGNQYYERLHAIVGNLNTGKTSGLSADELSYIQNAKTKLANYISSDSDIWTIAKNYQLFGLNASDIGDNQNIMWVENNAQYGSVHIQKCDTDLPAGCLPQGNANFGGITFEIYNNTGSKIYNPRDDKIYTNGQKITSGTTNSSGGLTFSNLLANNATYLVKETATNTTYQLTAGQQTTTLTTSGQTANLTFTDKVVTGNLTVNKVDNETGSCTNTTEGLSFNGTTFQLINRSTNPVYYGGQKYNSGAVVDTKQLPNNGCQVTFTGLPYGEYGVKETAAGTGYVVNSTEQRVNVPTSSGQAASITFRNQAIRGDVKFIKKDPTNDKAMKNTLFSISSIDKNHNIKETHLVVSNENGVVNTANSFAPHTFHTNGYDPLYDELAPITFSGFGSWFGQDSNGNSLQPNNNLGALPYGTYIIQELKCTSNLFCTGIANQKVTITINTANQIVDLGDWNNTCTRFSLETTATDAKDNDRFVEIDKKAKIKDKIEYCLKANVDFKIKGVLMDKATGEKLLINGEPVEQTIDINSPTDCGETEMTFTLDASELGGKEIVVFETLYFGDEIMTSHEDIDDEAQTIEIVSLKTIATNNLTGEKTLPHDSYAEIKDVVKYCLKPGVEYTIKGVLMNKENGESVKIDDEPVTDVITFTPEEACGEIEMLYKLNTTNLSGARLVVFETLSRDNEKIIEHTDLNNADQTVMVEEPEEPPVPDTGSISKGKTGASESNSIVFITGAIVIVGLGGYVSMRFLARRRIFRKKIGF